MSDFPKALSGNWHVFGQHGNWIASADRGSNTTVVHVFGFSAEEIKVRANAVSAVPDLLKALRDLIELVEIDPDANDPETDLYVSLKLAQFAVAKAEGKDT